MGLRRSLLARASRTSKAHSQVDRLLAFGGAKIPADLAAKSRAEIKARLKKKLDAKDDLRLQAIKLYGALQGASSIDIKNPANKSALDALLALNKKFAAKRLPFPKVRPVLGHSVPVTPSPIILSGTAVPPFGIFEYGHPVVPPNTPNPPSVSASGNNNTGQICTSVATSFTGNSSGQAFAQIGFNYSPPIPGILTIYCTPTYSYSWSTNGVGNLVLSLVELSLNILPMGNVNQNPTVAEYYKNEIDDIHGLRFKFGVDIQQSASLSLQVTPGLMYACYVSMESEASGGGWPYSVATAMVSATVPSISYVLTPIIK